MIQSRKKEKQIFTFNCVSHEEILNEIRKLQTATTIKKEKKIILQQKF